MVGKLNQIENIKLKVKDGDYEYLQKVWKKNFFEHFIDFFNLVYRLKKSSIIETKNTTRFC